jgi:hypothetical protein
MKNIILFFVCILFSYCSISQPKTKTEYNYLGLNIGVTTGVGISYEHTGLKDGFQITFLPLISKETARFSFAMTYLRNIVTKNNIDFFIFFGNHFTNFFADKGVVYYNFGIGPGFRWVEDSIDYQFMLGYAFTDITGDCNTFLAIELGAFYKF